MTLEQILHRMLAEAQRQEGRPSNALLSKGLDLSLLLDPQEGKTILRLTRAGVYPSQDEFETVLAHFPYPIQAIPRREQTGEEYVLVASWPTQTDFLWGDVTPKAPAEDPYENY